MTATDPEPEDGYAPSGVKSVTLPDGTVVEGGTADFAADANGKYDFIITDNGGNTFTLHTGVSNIDHLAPEAEYRDILDNLGNAASSTFNSFMTNAARFYLGYIKARETEDYLSKTLLSIISARQERSDKATVSVLYALAVELNILQRILVSHFDIPDEVYAELRRKARAEVAVSRKGAQIESVQAQMFGGDTGWQSSSQNGAI